MSENGCLTLLGNNLVLHPAKNFLISERKNLSSPLVFSFTEILYLLKFFPYPKSVSASKVSSSTSFTQALTVLGWSDLPFGRHRARDVGRAPQGPEQWEL